MWLASSSLAADTPTNGVLDPSYWINFGVLGVIFLAVQLGWLHTKGDYERTQIDHERELERIQHSFDRLEADHSRELARLTEERARERAAFDADKTRILAERDHADAERDEAYQVVRDFNQMAGALIQKLPTIGANPRPRKRPAGN